MIVEHALLPVRPGLADAFEAAFAEAYPIIAAMPGFGGLSLSRCVERPDSYLLLVRWERLTDHTEGFRGSPEYQRWRALLHHFYEPFPVVEHFAPVLGDEVFPASAAVATSAPADK
ncbi:antibiotic biosynthesis monooxygenase family protein [Nocardia sp. NPDC058176]|uniref:antibiotic biosynthesis monooxygenase family protein n=1 Tax=Nocardia sp. NPDC058176 TaxID=3346368 RepID=UPI0036DE6C88